MSPRVSRTGRDHAERVDGPATSERRYGEEERGRKRGKGGRKRERSRVARWWVYGGGRGWGDRGKEDESPACIRYLSRRCCVQVNKLTRRRASAIFFPINLNLLLILFSYPTYPESPTAGSPPALAFPLPPLARTIPLSLCRRDLPLSFPPSPLCLYHRRVASLFYSFLISRRFSVPSLSFSLFSGPSRLFPR